MLEITEQAVGDVTVLRLNGRWVLEDSDTPLRGCMERLFQQNRLKVVLDLAGVTYIDSCGLGMLVSKFVGARRRGGDVRLAHLTPRSMHLMEVTKLTGVFAIFESEIDAVQSFAPR